MNRIDRGAFLTLSITVLAGSAVALGSCSGDSEEDPGGGGSGGSAGSGGSGGMCARDAQLTHTSGADHDHLPLTTMITPALRNGAPFEFRLPTESSHAHTLSFSQQDLTNLRAGMTIPKTSTSDSGHTHTYDVKCV